MKKKNEKKILVLFCRLSQFVLICLYSVIERVAFKLFVLCALLFVLFLFSLHCTVDHFIQSFLNSFSRISGEKCLIHCHRKGRIISCPPGVTFLHFHQVSLSPISTRCHLAVSSTRCPLPPTHPPPVLLYWCFQCLMRNSFQ